MFAAFAQALTVQTPHITTRSRSTGCCCARAPPHPAPLPSPFVLSRRQNVSVVVAGVTATSLVIFNVRGTHRGKSGLLLALVLGLLLAVLLRILLQLTSYWSSLKPVQEAAPTDGRSYFTNVRSPRSALGVHYRQTNAIDMHRSTQMLAFHGFGASALSFDHYAAAVSANTSLVAMDRPGFGFTQRPSSNRLNLYTDYFLANRIAPQVVSAAFGDTGRDTVVIAHSLGAKAATLFAAQMMRSQTQSPIKALVLIAPAIFAGRESQPRGATPPLVWLLQWIRNVMCLALDVASPLLKALLIFSYGEKKSWRRGLSVAWFNKVRLSDSIVDRYQSPGRCKAWPAGILRFVKAAVLGPALLHEAVPAEQLDVRAELSSIASAGLPILIVTGEQDYIVPAFNAKSLVRTNPQIQLRIMKSCGHVPHEERTEDFAEIVNSFLASLS